MSKSRVFFVLLISFVGGIFARSFLELPIVFYYFSTLAVLVALAIAPKNKNTWATAMFVGIFLIGAWSLEKEITKRTDSSLAGREVWERVVVSNDTQLSGVYQKTIFVFKDLNIHVIASVPISSHLAYGDEAEISCMLSVVENLPTGQAGKDPKFDYRMYLAKDHVEYECRNLKILSVAKSSHKDIFALLLEMRKFFEEKINEVIPQPEGALAVGLIFGGSGGLSENLKNDFSRTGLTHIIAVSGYNVTIVAKYLVLLGIFAGLWRNKAVWFGIFGIAAFVIMAGMPASAVRAGVMASVVLWAAKNGRLATSYNAILLAAAIMLIFNPLLLRYDIGFQLSFMATIGIVTCSQLWSQSEFSKLKLGGLIEALILTLGAQIFVWPIIAYNFQTFSVISLVANMLVLEFIPFSMLLVFVVALASLLNSFLTLSLAWIAYAPLRYEVFVIETLGKISWASAQIQNISPFFVFCYYLLVGLASYVLMRRQQAILLKSFQS